MTDDETNDDPGIDPVLWAEIERRYLVAMKFAASVGEVLGASWRVEHLLDCPANLSDAVECTCGCLACFSGLRSTVCVDAASRCYSYPLH